MSINKRNKQMKHNYVKIVLKGGLVVFFIAANVLNAVAEQRRGTIRGADVIVLGSGFHRLEIRVDTTGNRIADSQLHFPDPVLSGFARNLQEFVERGMEIVFDDEGHMVLPSGNIQVSGDNTISIDGVNMIELFPGERARFRFAAQALDRQTRSYAPGGKSVKTAMANAQPAVLPPAFRRKVA